MARRPAPKSKKAKAQPFKKAKASRKAKPAKRTVAKKSAPAKATRKGQWVYAFGGGKAEGRATMRDLLGGKGAGLAEMANLGLPVPPGFTITTAVCTHFYANGK
jgi:pyruvate,orthophosphate dikinase